MHQGSREGSGSRQKGLSTVLSVRQPFLEEMESKPQEHLSSHRPLSSSFLRLPYRILNINHKEELLRGLWVINTTTMTGAPTGTPEGGAVSVPKFEYHAS